MARLPGWFSEPGKYMDKGPEETLAKMTGGDGSAPGALEKQPAGSQAIRAEARQGDQTASDRVAERAVSL